jgi:hypothetical protein
MERWLIWVREQQLQGWACSQCEWSFPVPTLLSNHDAKSAYDRLASSKFAEHKCQQHSQRASRSQEETFTERARKLITRGFKPRDAVEITLEEIMLEHGNNPKIIEKARADAEVFLSRVKEGLV